LKIHILAKPTQIIVAGKKEEVRSLLCEINKQFLPNKVLLLADEGTGQKWLSDRLEFIKV
jgi:hypothetical protein